MKRIAMTAQLKQDSEIVRRYEELHANPWPEVLAAGYAHGICRAFIYRVDFQLFMFLETSNDFEMRRDLETITSEPGVREWDLLMRELLQATPGDSSGSAWTMLKEIHAVEN